MKKLLTILFTIMLAVTVQGQYVLYRLGNIYYHNGTAYIKMDTTIARLIGLSNHILYSDTSSKIATWKYVADHAGSIYTASNGLTMVGNDVQLGGNFTSDILLQSLNQKSFTVYCDEPGGKPYGKIAINNHSTLLDAGNNEVPWRAYIYIDPLNGLYNDSPGIQFYYRAVNGDSAKAIFNYNGFNYVNPDTIKWTRSTIPDERWTLDQIAANSGGAEPTILGDTVTHFFSLNNADSVTSISLISSVKKIELFFLDSVGNNGNQIGLYFDKIMDNDVLQITADITFQNTGNEGFVKMTIDISHLGAKYYLIPTISNSNYSLVHRALKIPYVTSLSYLRIGTEITGIDNYIMFLGYKLYY
jgi:hypothetical protein